MFKFKIAKQLIAQSLLKLGLERAMAARRILAHSFLIYFTSYNYFMATVQEQSTLRLHSFIGQRRRRDRRNTRNRAIWYLKMHIFFLKIFVVHLFYNWRIILTFLFFNARFGEI